MSESIAQALAFDHEWNEQWGDNTIEQWHTKGGGVFKRVFVAQPTKLRYAIIRQHQNPHWLDLVTVNIDGLEHAKNSAQRQANATGDRHSAIAYVDTRGPWQFDPKILKSHRQQQNDYIVENARRLRRLILGDEAADAYEARVQKKVQETIERTQRSRDEHLQMLADNEAGIEHS